MDRKASFCLVIVCFSVAFSWFILLTVAWNLWLRSSFTCTAKVAASPFGEAGPLSDAPPVAWHRLLTAHSSLSLSLSLHPLNTPRTYTLFPHLHLAVIVPLQSVTEASHGL